ncbi:MarR family winged helix-turn-helix transcriptional regulator [Gemmiger sp.]
MSTPEIPDWHGVFRFVARLHTLSKRGMRAALAKEPKCRFGMLQQLHTLIEQHGQDGAIYVSTIARQVHQPMPAVSRGLRQMEQDGHIVRETDPRDRRKTLVRITPEGEAVRLANEQAMNAYFARIMARLTPEELAQANAVKDALLEAIEAENAAMEQHLKGEPPHDEDI